MTAGSTHDLNFYYMIALLVTSLDFIHMVHGRHDDDVLKGLLSLSEGGRETITVPRRRTGRSSLWQGFGANPRKSIYFRGSGSLPPFLSL